MNEPPVFREAFDPDTQRLNIKVVAGTPTAPPPTGKDLPAILRDVYDPETRQIRVVEVT